jgi:2-haloalkanoic acid dehalogenase type II
MNPAPSVVLLDVNETLSDLAPLAERFEEVGAPGDLLATWFAGTLRDGIALAASGRYAAFAEVARAALRPLLARVRGLGAPVDEAADHVLAGIGTLPVHSDVEPGLRRMRDAGLRIATLTNGSAATAAGLLERAGIAHLVEGTSTWRRSADGNRRPSPTRTPAGRSASRREPRFWSPSIPGTSTARSAPGCAAPGSTVTEIPTPACSAHPTRAPLSCRSWSIGSSSRRVASDPRPPGQRTARRETTYDPADIFRCAPALIV